MTRQKLRLLLDECVPQIISGYKKLSKTANLKIFPDIGLSYGVEDEQVLSAGQKEKRLVLTFDKKGGFSIKEIRRPTYKDTGVILIPEKYSLNEIDFAVYSLSKEVSQEDLTQSRTKIKMKSASILTLEDEEIEIEFT
jgi:hypothetical protein